MRLQLVASSDIDGLAKLNLKSEVLKGFKSFCMLNFGSFEMLRSFFEVLVELHRFLRHVTVRRLLPGSGTYNVLASYRWDGKIGRSLDHARQQMKT